MFEKQKFIFLIEEEGWVDFGRDKSFELLISGVCLENGNNAADVRNKFSESRADLRKQGTWAI